MCWGGEKAAAAETAAVVEERVVGAFVAAVVDIDLAADGACCGVLDGR